MATKSVFTYHFRYISIPTKGVFTSPLGYIDVASMSVFISTIIALGVHGCSNPEYTNEIAPWVCINVQPRAF